MHICPLLKDAKVQEKDYRGYMFDNPSLNLRTFCKVQGRVKHIQVTPVVIPSTPMINQIECTIKMFILVWNFCRVDIPLQYNKQYYALV